MRAAHIRRWTFALAVAFMATVWVSQPRAATVTFSANPGSLGAIPDSPPGGSTCGDASVFGAQFGQNGDIPVASYNVH